MSVTAWPQLMEVPERFPDIVHPADNEFTEARWLLGKMLFYDNIMSVDTSQSCASCHKQEFAFSDNVAVSPGVGGKLGRRNAPTLANIGYHPYFTREGGVQTLETQVLVPIQEHDEFDFNIVLIADRLNNDSTYVRMAIEAYQRTPDPFVITRSIACFERSLISGNSPYDRFQQFGEDKGFSPAAKRGMDLFFSSKTNCSSCHSGIDFTNYAFENNGLYIEYADEGRFRLTQDEDDRAVFKVPSLRNVAITAPYMHDGSMSTLEQVVEHYIRGGFPHKNKNDLIKPLTISESDKTDLIIFLQSLTDDTFISNPLFN